MKIKSLIFSLILIFGTGFVIISLPASAEESRIGNQRESAQILPTQVVPIRAEITNQDNVGKEPFCKVTIDLNGEKRITCEAVAEKIISRELPKPAEEKIRQVVPMLNDSPIGVSKDPSVLKPTQSTREEIALRDSKNIEEFKLRLENFKGNIQENSENLRRELEQKRETLRTEIANRGENGLNEILQKEDRRLMILEMQIKQLRLRLMANFERVSVLGNRLMDITKRTENRIEKMKTAGLNIGNAEIALEEVKLLISELENKISNAVSSINAEQSMSLEDLKKTGEEKMSVLKNAMQNIKNKIEDILKNLKEAN